MHKFLFILLLFSCSSYHKKKDESFANKKVSSYFSHWKKENSNLVDNKFKNNYSKYLSSVEEVFLQQGMERIIDFYFETLKTVDKDMISEARTNKNLYKSEKTVVSIEQFDDLLDQRSEKLIEYYGFDFYKELKKNRKNFAKNENLDLTFPL